MAELTEPPFVAIWSDFICPFCHVARERAEWLQKNAGAVIEWLPFDLHPEYPPEGIPRADLLKRYGDHFTDAVKRTAEEAGVGYNPHPDIVPNSRKALELSEWARGKGPEAHEALHERIMRAYWSEARDIGRWEELEACLADVGLDPAEGRDAVESGGYAAAVDASTQHAQRAGISAVPAFVFDGRLLVSGAVPHEVFERALEKLAEMRAGDPPADPA